MNSPYSLTRGALALVAASTLLLAGCGQKGPLFMPKIPPDPLAKTSSAPAVTPSDSSAKAVESK